MRLICQPESEVKFQIFTPSLKEDEADVSQGGVVALTGMRAQMRQD